MILIFIKGIKNIIFKVIYYMYCIILLIVYILFIFDYNYFIRKCFGKCFFVYNILILEYFFRQEVVDDVDIQVKENYLDFCFKKIFICKFSYKYFVFRIVFFLYMFFN